LSTGTRATIRLRYGGFFELYTYPQALLLLLF
jgi:hypothetical protein